MALLISIYSCDFCGQVASLKTEADWQNFEKVWLDSIVHHYCPKCKEMPAIKKLAEKEIEVFYEACLEIDGAIKSEKILDAEVII